MARTISLKMGPYWDAGGLRLLRELTFLFLHRRGRGVAPLAISGLVRALSGVDPEAHSGRLTATERAREASLRRFLFNMTKQQKVHSRRLLDELFHLIVPWFAKEIEKSEMRKNGFIDQVRSRGWFELAAQRKARATGLGSRGMRRVLDEAGHVADMLALGFGVTDRDFAEASEHLTGREACAAPEPSPHDQVGFVTYRYSASAGNIIRTFTVVTPPSAAYPFCWFQNFYRYQDRKVARDSHGVVVRLGGNNWFLGILPPRDGIKVMIFPSAPGDAGLYSGLVASANNEGAPLMSRVVLERSSYSTVEQLPVDLMPSLLSFPLSEAERPRKEILERMRNHIEFRLGAEITHHSSSGDKMITATEMKKIVAEMCQGCFSLYGRSFNPAEHFHYPFNQALKFFSIEEIREPSGQAKVAEFRAAAQ